LDLSLRDKAVSALLRRRRTGDALDYAYLLYGSPRRPPARLAYHALTPVALCPCVCPLPRSEELKCLTDVSKASDTLLLLRVSRHSTALAFDSSCLTAVLRCIETTGDTRTVRHTVSVQHQQLVSWTSSVLGCRVICSVHASWD